MAYCNREYGFWRANIEFIEVYFLPMSLLITRPYHVLPQYLNVKAEEMARWIYGIRPPLSTCLPPDYKLLREFKKQYKLGKNLGGGAFGYVYHARQRSGGRKVAVKFVQADDDRLWLEHPKWGLVPRDILVMSELEHEYIVKLIDVFRDEEYVYVVSTIVASVCYKAEYLIPRVGTRVIRGLMDR